MRIKVLITFKYMFFLKNNQNMFEADLFVRDIENVTTCTALYLRRKTWAWDILSFPKALGA